MQKFCTIWVYLCACLIGLAACGGAEFTSGSGGGAVGGASSSSSSTGSSSSGNGGQTSSSSTSSSSTSSSSSSSSSSSGTGGSGSGCTPDQKVCDSNCVAKNDSTHGCAAASCDPCNVPNAIAGCESGMCAVASCQGGFSNCNALPADGCEQATDADPLHCGGCNTVCSATQACSGGKCHELCGKQTVPDLGYSECWVMNKDVLGVDTYAAVAYVIGQPASTGGAYSPNCISKVAAAVANGTDSSVLCPLPGVSAGNVLYHSLRSYDQNDNNPPSGAQHNRCDPWSVNPLVQQKCLVAKVVLYHDGLQVPAGVSYVPPAGDPWYTPQGPFGYYTQNPTAIQITVTLP